MPEVRARAHVPADEEKEVGAESITDEGEEEASS